MVYTLSMAIKIDYSEDKKSATINVDNGDLKAINTVLKQWTFNDVPAMLRFVIAVLLSTQDKKLYAEKDGKKIILTPADSLLKDGEEDKSNGETKTS